jgi:hypothetical protein
VEAVTNLPNCHLFESAVLQLNLQSADISSNSIYMYIYIYIFIYLFSRVIQLVLPSRANPPKPSVLSILNIESSALHCGHHFFPPCSSNSNSGNSVDLVTEDLGLILGKLKIPQKSDFDAISSCTYRNTY